MRLTDVCPRAASLVREHQESALGLVSVERCSINNNGGVLRVDGNILHGHGERFIREVDFRWNRVKFDTGNPATEEGEKSTAIKQTQKRNTQKTQE
jgi:hypothetical protein